MKAYKVVIETMFVRLPGQKGWFGFFSTSYVQATTAQHAVNQACKMVKKKVNALGGEQLQTGAYAVTLFIKDIWEIEESAFSNANSSGATFYPMSALALPRLLWLRQFRSHLIYDLSVKNGVRDN